MTDYGDLVGGGSDAVIDALVVHGTALDAAARVGAHLDAGANHVAVQLITTAGVDPLPQYEQVAATSAAIR